MLRITTLLLSGSIIAAPLVAQTAATQPATGGQPATTATAAANVTAGAAVSDPQGGSVGTIESVANNLAVLSTDSNKVSIPTSSFAQGEKGLVIALTKADIDAKASAAAAVASAPPEITVGAVVADQTGAKVGTVKAVAGDLVTVQSATASAQLPKSSFAKGPNRLVIAMSPAQFDEAAKAAGAKTPAAG